MPRACTAAKADASRGHKHYRFRKGGGGGRGGGGGVNMLLDIMRQFGMVSCIPSLGGTYQFPIPILHVSRPNPAYG